MCVSACLTVNMSTVDERPAITVLQHHILQGELQWAFRSATAKMKMSSDVRSKKNGCRRGRAFFLFLYRVFADAKVRQRRNKIHLWAYFTDAGKLQILSRWKIQSKHLRWASLLSWQRQAPTNWLYCTSLVLIKWLTAWGTKEATELQQSYGKWCTWLLSSSFSWHFSKNTE